MDKVDYELGGLGRHVGHGTIVDMVDMVDKLDIMDNVSMVHSTHMMIVQKTFGHLYLLEDTSEWTRWRMEDRVDMVDNMNIVDTIYMMNMPKTFGYRGC